MGTGGLRQSGTLGDGGLPVPLHKHQTDRALLSAACSAGVRPSDPRVSPPQGTRLPSAGGARPAPASTPHPFRRPPRPQRRPSRLPGPPHHTARPAAHRPAREDPASGGERGTPRLRSAAQPPPPAPFVVTGSPGNRLSPRPDAPLPAALSWLRPQLAPPRRGGFAAGGALQTQGWSPSTRRKQLPTGI
ncbi:proline-rich protein 2-like isoform X2 [Cynocephalus volans]|uniref:proline-rich protein 2-like isoform X2 n=1 Tax=Cynocephalus volans TaxID=110931 RepID=UPI002FC6A4F3